MGGLRQSAARLATHCTAIRLKALGGLGRALEFGPPNRAQPGLTRRRAARPGVWAGEQRRTQHGGCLIAHPPRSACDPKKKCGAPFLFAASENNGGILQRPISTGGLVAEFIGFGAGSALEFRPAFAAAYMGPAQARRGFSRQMSPVRLADVMDMGRA